VPAAAHGDFEIQRARERDGVGDVGGALASRDQRRPFVDEPVMDVASLVVAGVSRLKQLSAE
jgi:hypothetical protein